MAAFVPALRAYFQRLVITLFVLLDQPLETDVASDFVAEVITLQQEQEPRNPTVAVTKRMDAEKIQIKSRQREKWMHPALLQTTTPIIH